MGERIITYITENYVDVVAAIIGLLYLYLEYKASIWMWLVSIVMAVFFIYIFYSTQLYASMTIYAYFLVASVYGWIAWMRKGRDDDSGEHIILRLSKKYTPIILIAVVSSFAIIAGFLYYFTENRNVILWGDALTTALNIVALWMASRKWAEQWCLLVPANLLSGVLLMIQGEFASSTMFYIYFVVSIFGYFNWKRMADRQIR